MKTVSMNLYLINELSKEAQIEAYNEWLDNEIEFPYDSEFSQSIDEFQEAFDFNYNTNYYNEVEFYDNDIADLKGVRLYKYLINNYANIINFDCKLTGYYIDNLLLKPIVEFMKKPRNITFAELMSECKENWEEGYNKEHEWHFSFEHFVEDSLDLQRYYLADGTLYSEC